MEQAGGHERTVDGFGDDRRRFLSLASAAGLAGIAGAASLGERPAAADPIEAPNAMIVFDPTATSSDGNVYKTWPEVVDAVGQSAGPHTIYIASDAHATSGTWDLGDIVTFMGTGTDWFFTGTTLTLDEGCVFDPPPSFVLVDAGLLLLSASSSAVITQQAQMGGLAAMRGGTIASETTPLYVADNTGDLFDPLPMIAVLVMNEEGRLINGDLFPGLASAGNSPLMELDEVIISVNFGGGLSTLTDDIIQGYGQLVLGINGTAATHPPTSFSNPGFTPAGSTIVNRSTRASSLGYEPAAPADWDTPPSEAQSALDELAARVAQLEGP